MINLLADDRKDAIKAARVNVFLVRYIAILLMAFAFLMAALYVSHTVLGVTMKNAESLIASNDVKASVYSETSKEVEALSSKLNETRGILSQEVHYSQVLVQLGQLMPKGTILGELVLDRQSFSGQPIEMKAYAKSTTEASALQAQFQSSPLFRKVTLSSTETKQEVDGYPVSITMSVVFNRVGM